MATLTLQPSQSMGSPTLRPEFKHYYLTKILDLPIYIVQIMIRCLDTDSGMLHPIAAEFEDFTWKQQDITNIANQREPGQAFINELGIRNYRFCHLWAAMLAAEYWDGLAYFCEPMTLCVQEHIPRRINLTLGEPLHIQCKASGIPPPSYQWFYFPKGCETAKPIAGQNKSTLFLEVPQWLVGLKVCCSIKNSHNTILEGPCSIEPEQAAYGFDGSVLSRTSEPSNNKATVKVALLIGNEIYMSHTKLPAASADTKKIRKKLQEMGFWTIVCKDLNYDDMEKIFEWFASELSEGAYVVILFAGHGFERNGDCYMVPTNCQTMSKRGSCISTRKIKRKILLTKPALLLILLDACRTVVGAEDGDHVSMSLTAQHPVHSNETMVVYATGEGANAFEVKHKSNPESLLTKHLLMHIDKRASVKHVIINCVLESMGKDKTAQEYYQHPMVLVNLSTDKSLWDVQHPSDEVTQKWQQYTKEPTTGRYLITDDLTLLVAVEHEYTHIIKLFICIEAREGSSKGNVCPLSIDDRDVHIQSQDFHANICAKHITKDRWPLSFKRNSCCLSLYEAHMQITEHMSEVVSITLKVIGKHSGMFVNDSVTITLRIPQIKVFKRMLST